MGRDLPVHPNVNRNTHHMNEKPNPFFDGVFTAITGKRVDIKLKRMPDTANLSAEQAQALNKLLDLVADLMYEVSDDHDAKKYDRRYSLILDKLFPERVEWRKNKSHE